MFGSPLAGRLCEVCGDKAIIYWELYDTYFIFIRWVYMRAWSCEKHYNWMKAKTERAIEHRKHQRST